MMLRRKWLFAAFALVGLALTVVAVSWWSPEGTIELADPGQVARQALADAQALGFRVEKQRFPELTMGSRAYATNTDVRVLLEQVADPAERRRLLAAVPPVRLGVRFWDAVGSDGSPGVLLLEYGPGARLVSASFGWNGIVQAGLQPYAGPEFAHRLAERLLGEPPPEPEIVKMGGGIEYVYRRGAGQSGVYVYLGGSARWIASLQSAPYAMLTRQLTFFQNDLGLQALGYLLIAMVLMLIANLLWRLRHRRAGFGHTRLLGALIVLGLLPGFGHLPAGRMYFLFALNYVLAGGAILLLWAAAEAELRETRPGAIEHWDRLVCRQPVAATGEALVTGVLFGAGLAGIIAAAGRLVEMVGGGYRGLLLILPEYWGLP
ncbi:MAG: hypothetical protein O7A04_03605, partial [Acidobacteria bacterium]|nr:hypothetical protein [Acidobacteriota bacterium]